MLGPIEGLTFFSHFKVFQPYFSDKVYRAVRYGHRQLAAYMIAAFSSYNFNDLHIATLKNNTQPLKVGICCSKSHFRELMRDSKFLHFEKACCTFTSFSIYEIHPNRSVALL